MFISSWKRNETCFDSTVSFHKGLPPIALLRAAPMADGKWESVLRDYHSEGQKMIGSRPGFATAEEAMADCYRLLKAHFGSYTAEVGPIDGLTEDGYNIVHVTKTGPSAGVRTWTRFNDQASYDNWKTNMKAQGKDWYETLAEGIPAFQCEAICKGTLPLIDVLA